MIKVGVVTQTKSTAGRYAFRLVGHHDGVGSKDNEKWGYPCSGSSPNVSGVGKHSVFHEGSRIFVNEFSEDGSFGIIGAFPRGGPGTKGSGSGGYDQNTSKYDADYARADTPIKFKNPGIDGGDDEMDTPDGQYCGYAGGKTYDPSSYQYPQQAKFKDA